RSWASSRRPSRGPPPSTPPFSGRARLSPRNSLMRQAIRGMSMLARMSAAAAVLIGALTLGLAPAAPAAAQEEALEPEHHHWHFAGPFGPFDRAALQRGYQVYRQVCSSCHSMKFVAFRHLGQEGGPYFEEAFPNPNDNPTIKALAAEFTVQDGPDDTGS